METKEIEQIANTAGEKAKAVFEQKATEIKTELETKLTEVKDGIEEKQGKIVETLEGLKTDIATISTKQALVADKKVKSFGEQVAEELEAKSADLLSMKDKRTNDWAHFEIKAAGDMFVRNGVGPGGTPASNYEGTYALTQLLPGVTDLLRRAPFVRQYMNSFFTSKPRIAYVEKVSRDGAAAVTAEGAKKAQIDFDFKESTAEVVKITAFVKASKEALDDLPFLRSQINTELVEAIQLTADKELFEGAGGAGAIKGLEAYATTIVINGSTNSTFYQTVDSPNFFDVLRVAQAIIANNTFERLQATHVFVNPNDKYLAELTKDKNGNYIIPPFGTSDRMGVSGVTVVANSLVPEGEFLMADMTKSNLAIRENITISIGYENDDFTKNMVTILAEMRLGHFVKANHLGAFVKGTFADVAAAIAKPVAS